VAIDKLASNIAIWLLVYIGFHLCFEALTSIMVIVSKPGWNTGLCLSRPSMSPWICQICSIGGWQHRDTYLLMTLALTVTIVYLLKLPVTVIIVVSGSLGVIFVFGIRFIDW
jgi:hypothetical protein